MLDNYLQTFSTDFLFIKGDLNLRHSIDGVGQFYVVELIALLLGATVFFLLFKDRKIKLLIAVWIVLGVMPSAITRSGGYHATRLILVLPPLVFLIAYGLVEGLKVFRRPVRVAILLFFIGMYIVGFAFYQHNYWYHNPWRPLLNLMNTKTLFG